MKMFITWVMLTVTVYHWSHGSVIMKPEGESVNECLRFTFQEKVLEKLVDMEYKFQKLEERFAKLSSKTKASLKDMTAKQDATTTPKVMFSSESASKRSSSYEVMVFENTEYNFGGGYDNISGMFIAPVSGTYLFTAFLCTYDRYRIQFSYEFFVEHITHISDRMF